MNPGTKQCTQFGEKTFFERFREKTQKDRVPISGSIELTKRCNLRCVHCYNGSLRYNTKDELSTEEWKEILEQITGAGCLFLLITGGEPLIRPDFSEIYTHAKKLGLIVTIFTNGTLITKEHIELFREFPPSLIDITLYGAREETYEAITGIKGSYRKCLKGIEDIMDANLHLKLKTVILRENQDEFEEIREFAKSRGLGFRSDPCITASLDGDLTPIDHRPDPERAVKAEFSDPAVVENWREFFRKQPKEVRLKKLYGCGAGRTSFHISSTGILTPCLMTTSFSYDLKKGAFTEGWQ
ncbi:MAG: radical SAM protein, partial [Nitrospirae bacterium]